MNIIEKTYKLNGDLKVRTKTNRIILHHAAAINCTADDIDRWHKNNGWTCIGYHFFVNKKGEVYRGRKENTVGAHAGDNNMDSLGICAEGNFEKETMGEAQKKALKELVAYLKNKYGISKVQKHRDVNATACPGKNYPFEEIAKATIEKEDKKEDKKEDVLYKVQVGAFANRENAINYAKELEAKGYDTYIVYIDKLYKVQLGAFSKEENANNLVKELNAKGIDAFITTKTGKTVNVEKEDPITRGKAVKLNNAALYVSSSSSKVVGRLTGTYYLWDAEVINNRIRVTNSKTNVGNASQVTGWISKNDI